MDIFDLSAKITLDSSEFEKGVKDASGSMEGLSATAVALGNAIYDIGTKAASAFGTLVESAVGGYAKFEQLVGGIDKLFGTASGAVQKNASEAFATAGLSANDYMETVTGFAASLVNSLEGDTQKAADYADMAITDMADNANTFGTSMSSLQATYQAFAKQNYSMLDNLKLGFGGTQQEMYRLLQTAQELEPSFDAAFSIDSKGHLEAEFADIVEAIHIVQKDMEILGTTANEASGTVSGSIDTMKAAWENWLVGLGDSNADMTGLTNNLITSVQSVWTNLQPVLDQIGESIAKVFEDTTGIDTAPLEEAFSTVKTTLETVFTDIKTAYESGGVSGVFDELAQKAGELTNIDFSPFTDFIKNFAEETPTVIEAVATAVEKLATAAGENASGAIEATADNTSKLLQSFTDTAADRVVEVADGIGKLADTASENNETFSTLAQNISDFLAPFTDIVALAVDSITQDAVELVNAFSQDAADHAVAFADAMNKLFEYLQPFVQYMEDSVTIISDFITVVEDSELTAREKGEAIGKIFVDAATAVKTAWDDTLAFFEGLPQDIYDCFTGIGTKFSEIGHEIVEGIKSGISSAWDSLTGFVSGLWDGLFNSSKKDNEINSPSKLYAKIGEYMAMGVGEGWAHGIKDFKSRMSMDWGALSGTAPIASVDFASSAIGKSSSAQITSMMTGMQERGGNYNINLVVDGRTLANVVFDPLHAVSKQKGVVLGA